jgi:hypothetical protein
MFPCAQFWHVPGEAALLTEYLVRVAFAPFVGALGVLFGWRAGMDISGRLVLLTWILVRTFYGICDFTPGASIAGARNAYQCKLQSALLSKSGMWDSGESWVRHQRECRECRGDGCCSATATCVLGCPCGAQDGF